MNILLAGHAGFIGKRLSEILTEAGHQVWKFNRGDSLKWGSICHADLVINAAGALKNEDRMIDDNLVFAAQLANACYVFNKRLIHIGSIASRTQTRLYGATKKAAEDIVLTFAREKAAKFCIVSPATVFGPGDNSESFMSRIWNSHEFDMKLMIMEEGRDWVYIDDLCRAILMITEADPFAVLGQIFEVGYGKSVQNSQLIYTFEHVVGQKIPYEIVARTQNNWYADTVTIKELGWEPKVSLMEGIVKFTEHKLFDGRAWLGAEA